jgi:thiol-disulfide isomerase/thioredoxin
MNTLPISSSVVVGLSLFLFASGARAETPTTGAPAIAFKAQTMNGKEVDFPKSYKGKLVLLDFWATWCGPCMGELPGLVQAYEQFHPRGLEVLGITLDRANATDKIKAVMADKKMTWEQVYDGQGWKARVATMYGIHSIPHAFLIDGDSGKVVAEGHSLRGDNLAKTIETALKEKGTASVK